MIVLVLCELRMIGLDCSSLMSSLVSHADEISLEEAYRRTEALYRRASRYDIHSENGETVEGTYPAFRLN